MATEDVPILLMSATCRPQAVQSILDSLSIVPKHISLIQGELVRPELQYIRIYLARPLDTAEDLKPIIPSILDVSNKDLPPMLIYSGTQTGTMTVIEAVCNARGTPEDIRNGNSDCIQRFTSVTGDKDKVSRAKYFGEGKFPIFSATSALGLGQNWTRVRVVIVMGAMDPSETNQMGGRAGRGGDEGLVIMFVQSSMTKGPKSAEEIVVTNSMTNDDRMHAIRLTPCCLRVAYALDSL